MYVIEKRNDVTHGWEYRLKDTNGIEYGVERWVLEKDLKEA